MAVAPCTFLPVEPVGESVPCFTCCLAGVHNLASDTCCKSLHSKVDVFIKLGDLFQLPIDTVRKVTVTILIVFKGSNSVSAMEINCLRDTQV